MTRVAAPDRISRRSVDKFAERRDELAAAALQTLSELGYARTSLREIAGNADFSHGVLHYYFRDKVDLITHCVRQYKASCVTRYDAVVHSAADAAELRAGFGAAMAQTLHDDTGLHRLWYDLRTQSLFEPSFRADVVDIDRSLEAMVWRVVLRHGDLAGAPVPVTSGVAYALFDGLFQRALLAHLTAAGPAGDELAADAAQVLAGLAGVPAPRAPALRV